MTLFQRISLAGLACLALFAAGPGCTDRTVPSGQCEFDSQCGSGQVCASNLCRPTCHTNADCAPNNRCVAADHPGASACVPNAEMASSCARDSECADGLVCLDGQCRPQCRTDYDCQVVNPLSTCTGGRCIPRCTRTRADCDGLVVNGCEVELPTNPAHCGACGRACAVPANGSARCAAGECVNACDPGFADCDAVASNGCEAALGTDRAHCGACGRACGASEVCSAGACGSVCSAPGETRCAMACVNTATDLNNCGACGTACGSPANATATCAAGACGLACNAGFADCNMNPADGCEASLSTAENCGTCGRRCADATPTCAGDRGVFACSAAACAGAVCAGACVDTSTDLTNCGGCGVACRAGPNSEARCEAGRCALRCTDPARFADCDANPATGCEAELPRDTGNCGACGTACGAAPNATGACAATVCGIVCLPSFGNCDGADANGCEVDTRAAPTNCGRCGNACAAPANATPTCAAGACGFACNAGFADCDASAANGCEVNLNADRANCGRCGTACAAGDVCSVVGGAAACRSGCPAGQMNCAGVCADLATNTSNCGACGRACAAPANATSSCAAGACRFACNAGFGDCDGNPANGCETSLTGTVTSCGGCGMACALPNARPACSASRCVIAMCNAGFQDCNGMAADGCEVDTNTTLTSCGACGRACALPNARSACASGACAVVACNAGFADCDRNPMNGCEVDTRTSAGNCGGCGIACSAAGGTASCAAGACAIACAAGRGDCDRSAANGCEVDLTTSVANCNACGTACAAANATPVCRAGACGIGSCNAGFANCDGVVANGCEVNLLTTTTSCGACGRACTFPNAAASCAAGACALGPCNAGFADCDRNPANGCEVNLNADAANCGGCGRVCSLPHATAACPAGVCAVAICTGGFLDCNGASADGCEVNPATDGANCGRCGARCTAPQVCSASACTLVCAAPTVNCAGACTDTSTSTANCGRCGNACPSGPSSSPTCAAGACGLSCAAGFGNCDGAASNGCEVNLQTTTASCGACGRACSFANASASCAGGACVLGPCTAGFADCDGNAANGCEVNLNTDPAHCGSCARTGVCSFANAAATCASGRCVLGACNAGWGNCDGNPANGCETDTTTTVAHCGGCGTACSANHGVPACVGGNCAIACERTGSTDGSFYYRTFFGNCDGDARTNGCETDLLTTSNCQACRRACSFPNAAPTCSINSAVGCYPGACNPGFGDCNAAPSDGCEANLTNDNANCGACGTACIRGRTCRSSACRPPNDTCAGASSINLAGGRQIWINGDTTGTLHDIDPSCRATTSPDVYFTFTLTERELVYADTFGDGTTTHPAPTWDTVLFFANTCTTSMPASGGPAGSVYCNDDASSLGCTSTGDSNRSQVSAVLDPGTYYLVLSGFSGQSGFAPINFQHMPVGNGTAQNVATVAPGTALRLTGATSGAGTVAPSAACSAAGPEVTYWWRLCSTTPRIFLVASTCNAGSNYDTVVYYRDPVSSSDVCTDDDRTACSMNGALSTLPRLTVPAGAGIRAVTVDGYGAASAGTYVLTINGSVWLGALDPVRGVCRDPRRAPPAPRVRASLGARPTSG